MHFYHLRAPKYYVIINVIICVSYIAIGKKIYQSVVEALLEVSGLRDSSSPIECLSFFLLWIINFKILDILFLDGEDQLFFIFN